MQPVTRPGALILGLTANGVGALHSLNQLRQAPDPLIGIESGAAIGFASRVGHKRRCPPTYEADGKPLCEFVLSLAAEFDRRLVVIPCSDDYVQFVSNHRDALSERCLFLLPEKEMVDILLDKAKFDRLARELDIPAPAFAVVDAGPSPALPEEMRYPLVAKPLNTFKDNPLRKKIKVEEFASPEEWDEFFAPWEGSGASVAVQEKIIGDDTDVYVYGALWGPDAKPVSRFTGRKIRQFPKTYGSTAVATCRLEPEVVEKSEAILRSIKYRGLCDVEFKRERRDDKLRVIEINPRQGLWHRMGRLAGIDIVQDTYRLLAGESVAPIRQRPGNAGRWCYFARDIQRLKQDIKRTGLSSIPAWLGTYVTLPRDAVFSWNDPWPWASELWHLLTRRWTHKRRR